MKTLDVIIHPLTSLTNLPHSQNLFGYICYTLKDKYSNEKLEEILQNLANKKSHLSISSVMPESAVFWPLFEINYSITEKFDNTIAKQLKKIKYVQTSLLSEIQKHEYKGDFLVDNLQNKKIEILNDLLMYKGQLEYEYHLGINVRYSSKEQTIYNVKSYRISRNSNFHFYLKTDIPEVLQIFSLGNILSVGHKKNVGLNLYEVVDINEIQIPKSETNVLLSRYSPTTINEFDETNSLIKINMVHTAPDIRIYDKNRKQIVDSISLIMEGSIISTTNDKLGRLVPRVNSSEIIKKDIYYNGFAFLYPIGGIR